MSKRASKRGCGNLDSKIPKILKHFSPKLDPKWIELILNLFKLASSKNLDASDDKIWELVRDELQKYTKVLWRNSLKSHWIETVDPKLNEIMGTNVVECAKMEGWDICRNANEQLKIAVKRSLLILKELEDGRNQENVAEKPKTSESCAVEPVENEQGKIELDLAKEIRMIRLFDEWKRMVAAKMCPIAEPKKDCTSSVPPVDQMTEPFKDLKFHILHNAESVTDATYAHLIKTMIRLHGGTLVNKFDTSTILIASAKSGYIEKFVDLKHKCAKVVPAWCMLEVFSKILKNEPWSLEDAGENSATFAAVKGIPNVEPKTKDAPETPSATSKTSNAVVASEVPENVTSARELNAAFPWNVPTMAQSGLTNAVGKTSTASGSPEVHENSTSMNELKAAVPWNGPTMAQNGSTKAASKTSDASVKSEVSENLTSATERNAAFPRKGQTMAQSDDLQNVFHHSKQICLKLLREWKLNKDLIEVGLRSSDVQNWSVLSESTALMFESISNPSVEFLQKLEHDSDIIRFPTELVKEMLKRLSGNDEQQSEDRIGVQKQEN